MNMKRCQVPERAGGSRYWLLMLLLSALLAMIACDEGSSPTDPQDPMAQFLATVRRGTYHGKGLLGIGYMTVAFPEDGEIVISLMEPQAVEIIPGAAHLTGDYVRNTYWGTYELQQTGVPRGYLKLTAHFTHNTVPFLPSGNRAYMSGLERTVKAHGNVLYFGEITLIRGS